LLEREYKTDYKLFLGELQFAFIVFILGENLEGFEQWKRMIILICNCEDLMKESPQLFLDLIPVLYSQLKQLPKDFFVDNLSSDSFISNCLKYFLELGSDKSLDPKLCGRFEKLRTMLQENFTFQSGAPEQQFDLGEDAPTVVEDLNFIKLTD